MMTFYSCQWIDGEPNHTDDCKCGRPVVDPEDRGSRGTYCAEHAAKAVILREKIDAQALREVA